MFEEVCDKNEIAALLIVIHSGNTMGFQSNYKVTWLTCSNGLVTSAVNMWLVATSETVRTNSFLEFDSRFKRKCREIKKNSTFLIFWSDFLVRTTFQDDLAVFESTLNETLKLNFPLASSEIIKTHAIEFKIPDNNLKEMISKCSLKESSGTVSPKSKIVAILTYGIPF